jgi:oxygen-independent coproporphyrinogen-3 oxidase
VVFFYILKQLLKTKVAGIYIHIPFCKQACTYCNFHFSTNKKSVDKLINSLCKEIELRKHEVNESIETIYFGGGTPSIIEHDFIEKIINSIFKNYSVAPKIECTLEANPDDINEENLLSWKNIGVNRFSLGIQSFIEEELKWMNRSHNAVEAKNCIELIAKKFDNYSIDLIFGSQVLTTHQWIENIDTALSFQPPHLSCYALTVEEKTKLGKDVVKNKIANIEDTKQAEQFEILMNKLAAKGYVHYEISNYCKPNFESKHNSSYWKGKQYLGFGPSAHSYDGNNRSWNVANNALYIQYLENTKLPIEQEILTDEQKFNEYVMIGIRTIYGIDLNFIKENYRKFFSNIEENYKKLVHQNLLQKTKNIITLTQKGKLFADAIAVELFV